MLSILPWAGVEIDVDVDVEVEVDVDVDDMSTLVLRPNPHVLWVMW